MSPTNLDRAVQRAVDAENARYLAALRDAGPGACPNCLKQDGGWCWCCTARNGSNARDPEAWARANPTRRSDS